MRGMVYNEGMGLQCQICIHAKRAEIDAALVAGGSIRDIAGQFNLKKGSVERHRAHLGDALEKAAARREDLSLERVLGDLDKAQDALEWAVEEKVKKGPGEEWRQLPRLTKEMREGAKARALVTGLIGRKEGGPGGGNVNVQINVPPALPPGAPASDLSIPGVQDAQGRLLPSYLKQLEAADAARMRRGGDILDAEVIEPGEDEPGQDSDATRGST